MHSELVSVSHWGMFRSCKPPHPPRETRVTMCLYEAPSGHLYVYPVAVQVNPKWKLLERRQTLYREGTGFIPYASITPEKEALLHESTHASTTGFFQRQITPPLRPLPAANDNGSE